MSLCLLRLQLLARILEFAELTNELFLDFSIPELIPNVFFFVLSLADKIVCREGLGD